MRDDKGALRVDGNSRLGLLSGYYFIDDYRLDNPYPGAAGRRQRAGLRRADARPRAALVVRRQQGVRPEHRQRIPRQLHAQREQHRHAATAASASASRRRDSSPAPARPGIVVLAPQFEGVENIVFNTFTMGVTITGVNQTEQHAAL